MKKRAFTLVELMIVIAVIAVLVTIIMPKLGTSRTKSQLAACKSNLRHIAIALELYANDNGGYYSPDTSGGEGSYTGFNYLVPQYLKTSPLCPTGHTYGIITKSATAYWGIPAGSTIIISRSNDPNTYHSGVGGWGPQYVFGTGVRNY